MIKLFSYYFYRMTANNFSYVKGQRIGQENGELLERCQAII